ncbi:FAD-binding type 2 [Penicillium robsamsonii]|uniref:FAD-binding type 2 n=1 Tax=Penicillium robsamsonii TaxID=1792511 RepID=UPI002548B07F|nr:FAD-binding type 2 [Penicillium robsamsonii]KAJ5817483.1 FAD-binding type 2 [Penicillium robsamsonii]
MSTHNGLIRHTKELSPVGYVYPTDISCPAVDLSKGQSPEKCILGPAPKRGLWSTPDLDQIYSDGIDFHDTYTASDKCASSDWTGSAITIGGGYVWEEAYDVAFKRNVVIVGGGDPTVGCIGGYTQGGGHSPASHDYGLAADQVLEAQVVLATGSIVTANACQNSDLYFAIRGGGGGSYGVVTSMTPIAASKDTDAFLDAVTDIHEQYPSIMDEGFSGYGSWSINNPMKVFANESTGYVHNAAIMGKSLAEAQKIPAPLLQTLQKYNGASLSVSVSWFEFPTYAAYYQAIRTQLRTMIGAIAGEANEYTINNVELVAGGKVLTDVNDKYSNVNPAWRSAYIVEVVARGWPDESTAHYMNEADRNDPSWATNFYGTNYLRLEAIKKKYDPTGLFYCPTGVGSPSWYQRGIFALLKIHRLFHKIHERGLRDESWQRDQLDDDLCNIISLILRDMVLNITKFLALPVDFELIVPALHEC